MPIYQNWNSHYNDKTVWKTDSLFDDCIEVWTLSARGDYNFALIIDDLISF